MDPLSVIRAKRRDGKYVFLSDANDSPEQVETKFMPHRLTRHSAEFEFAELHNRDGARVERFSLPPIAQAEKAAEQTTANSKPKKAN